MTHLHNFISGHEIDPEELCRGEKTEYTEDGMFIYKPCSKKFKMKDVQKIFKD